MSRYAFTINEQAFDVEINAVQGNLARVTVNRIPYDVTIETAGHTKAPTRIQPTVAAPTRLQHTAAPPPIVPPTATAPVRTAPPKTTAVPASGAGTIKAQIPGKMLSILVRVGDTVSLGQVVAVMEAMKMENNILSPMNGTVKEIRVNKDTDVATDDVLMVIA